jgi:uncharacterized protein YbjQ (UPF0145 family)
MAYVCCSCGAVGGILKDTTFQLINSKHYCSNCARKYVEKAIESMIITTTNNVDGYKVKKYIDIESIEIVVGTGAFSEFGGGVADFFGTRSTAFERKLQQAKIAAIDSLKYKAFQKGGNAVIAIDLDYTEFSGNRIGLIVNGTIVDLESIYVN